jgi:hypothetical protein
MIHFFLIKMVDQAITLYCNDNKIPVNKESRMTFFKEKSSINSGTSAYLSRVCIEQLLKSSTILTSSASSNQLASLSSASNISCENSCKVS